MKKFIVLVLFICLFLITYIYQDEIYNVYTSFASKPNVTLKEKNDYTRSYSFKYVSLTDNFSPETLEEVRNVYYTILNSGVDEFSFYCKKDTTCLDNVKALANDQTSLSIINNYVHPFNSFKRITTNYDETNKVTVSIEHNYNDNVREIVLNKVSEIETEIWNSSMTNREKIKAAHDYIINHSRYDKERSDNGIINYQSDIAYGPLLQGHSLCGGYTDAMELFLEDLGIESYRISNDKHVWNGVFLDGTWYHLDLTWDDPITSNNQDILEYTYFLVNNEALEKADNNQHSFDKSIYLEFSN